MSNDEGVALGCLGVLCLTALIGMSAKGYYDECKREEQQRQKVVSRENQREARSTILEGRVHGYGIDYGIGCR